MLDLPGACLVSGCLGSLTSERLASEGRRRIALVIVSLGLGGAEMQVASLAGALVDRGWSVDVISLLPLCGLAPMLASKGIGLWSLDMKRGVPDPRGIQRLRRILRHLQPDIVHGHLAQATLLTRVTRLVCKMPVLVGTMHSLRLTSDRTGQDYWRERAHRITDSLSDMNTTICHAAAVRYVGLKITAPERMTVLVNGVDTERFRPDLSSRVKTRSSLRLSEDMFVWLAAGRFVPAKDWENLFYAFQKLKQPNHILLICGSGPRECILRNLARQLSLTDSVRFLGARTDVPELMNCADAFVMSSLREGLPMVLLEAGATGLPIVCTDVGGNAEVVIDEVSGFVVPPRSAKALAFAMERLASLPADERASFSNSARSHVTRNFSLDAVVSNWEAFYRTLHAKAMSEGASQWN
jgi:glycosyltransferase involved in cell wall biosynthesis